MSEQLNNSANEPRIVTFGPCRVIGVRYAGKNAHEEIPALWHDEFLPRMGEIKVTEHAGYAFGICRCLPGVTDGSFEYIAGLPAADDAPLPDGMVEARIGAGSYVVFSVPSLDDLMAAWQSTGAWFTAHPEWQGYCSSPETCDCANHPGFELYPPEFGENGKLELYLPIQPSEK